MPFPDWAQLRAIDADDPATYPAERSAFLCDRTGSLLDVVYDFDRAHNALGFDRATARETFARRHTSAMGYASSDDPIDRLNTSGVWRFRDLFPFWGAPADVVTLGEGRTILQHAPHVAREIGLSGGDLFLQYEGMNPSGSFKDNGMTAAFTHARMVDAQRVVCASTGNTSAALAMFARAAGIPGFVLVGSGKIAFGKLSQALDYAARTLQVAGDFDACLARVRELSIDRPELGIYLMNSINPFRLEGQKAVMYRVLEGLGWEAPDWIVCPGGNLGNCSAFGKAFMELKQLGMIDRVPRLAVVNARGAWTLDRIVNELGVTWNGGRYDRDRVDAEFVRMDKAGERAGTIASAIEINRPVNLPKALRAIEFMDGVVRSVDDRTILEHKALVGKHGYGCEPASAASVAGARRLIEEGVIKPGERVACVLTGHLLKDPDATVGFHMRGGAVKDADHDEEPSALSIPLSTTANRPVPVADDLDAILDAMS
ncbi:MAG: threonine synthase [Planctomycetota bacterium]